MFRAAAAAFVLTQAGLRPDACTSGTFAIPTLPLDEIVMVIDAQMPVRAKRIQYFDDRLFKAIHAAQTGELPFPKPGGGGSQGTLPLSVRAMPMTSPASGGHGSETDVVVESAS